MKHKAALKQERTRNAGVDFAKAIAIFCVIIIHNCGTALSGPLFTFDWVSAAVLRSAAAAAVPLFFLCSGALLLNPEKELSVKQLFRKRIPRILAALLVWAFLYKCFDLLAARAFTWENLLTALKETLLFKHKYHLYFLQIMLIVYLWLPVTRLLTKHASEQELRYFLALWAVFGLLFPAVKGFWPFTLLDGIPLQWAISMTYASVGYTVLGYYLDTRKPAVSAGAVSACAGFALTLAGTLLMSAKNGALYTGFLEGMSPGTALLAAGLFVLCSAETRVRNSKPVELLSRASFCIYLVHVFVISLLQKAGIFDFSPVAVSILLVCVINLAASFGIWFVLRKIPFVNKWLI